MKTLPFAKMSAPVATCRTVFLLARMGLIEGLDGFDPTKEAKVISPPECHRTGRQQR